MVSNAIIVLVIQFIGTGLCFGRNFVKFILFYELHSCDRMSVSWTVSVVCFKACN